MPGVYISYPFCPQKCSFCNFASGVFSRELERAYGEALLAELRQHSFQWTPDTVYLGGGTPSTIDSTLLAEALARLPGRPWREATMEAMPGTLTRERVVAWRTAGINRVSLGVQSFVTREVSRTGRRHTEATVAGDCLLLREEGVSNISLDLIAGLAGQTRESWEISLDCVERLAPPHISVYMFEIDEKSRLGSEVVRGGGRYGATDVPGEDLVAELYERAVERLAAIGLIRYEISNFAQPAMESLHNLKYWQRAPYVGFGSDAHSFDGSTRTANVEGAVEYVEQWRAGRSVRAETVIPADADAERFFLGLRLSRGIKPGQDEWQRWAGCIEQFTSQGLLEREGGTLRLTSRGVLLSNEVFEAFV